MSREYELALIVDTQRPNQEVDETVAHYETLLGEQGAEVVDVDRWGARKLAYEIHKRQQGDYTFFQFRAEPSAIANVDRECRLDEAVLRHLILQVEIPPAVAEDDVGESSEDGSDIAEKSEGEEDEA